MAVLRVAGAHSPAAHLKYIRQQPRRNTRAPCIINATYIVAAYTKYVQIKIDFGIESAFFAYHNTINAYTLFCMRKLRFPTSYLFSSVGGELRFPTSYITSLL